MLLSEPVLSAQDKQQGKGSLFQGGLVCFLVKPAMMILIMIILPIIVTLSIKITTVIIITMITMTLNIQE